MRLLEGQRNEVLDQLRAMAPDLVYRLELTLEALNEQGPPEQSEYFRLGRGEVIRKYLQKVGRPTHLREICEDVASPVSRFAGRSIWDGGKREVEQGRLVNVADPKDKTWVLALPEWQQKS
jgi:hypothetical protein